MAGDQIGGPESDCTRLGPHGRFCDISLAETSQNLELLWADTLSDTRTLLEHIKHLALGRGECIAFSILVSALIEISDCDHNSEHILWRIVKRLDLRAVRLGDLFLHLHDCVDERLGFRILHLLLHRVH